MATTSSNSSSSSNSKRKNPPRKPSIRPAMSKRTSTSHSKPFDIDLYLNPYIPAPRFHLLPTYISRWLGYRPPSTPQRPLSTILSALSTFLGAFCSIVLTCWIFSLFPPLGSFTKHSTTWPGTQTTNEEHGPTGLGSNPLIIASLGATALLEFTALSSPLAQPRALLLSQPLAALIGVAVSKGFGRLDYARYQDLEWLAGALAVAIASFCMVLTKTVHPPAGATALIAVVTAEGRGLGWWLVLLGLVGSACVGVMGLVVNNLWTRRHWPAFWWTEHPLAPPTIVDVDEEKAEVVPENGRPRDRRNSLGVVRSRRRSLAQTRSRTAEHGTEELDGQYLLDEELVIPEGFEISYEQMTVLRNIRERLEAAVEEEDARMQGGGGGVVR